MATEQNLYSRPAKSNPRPLKKWRAHEISDEIRAVDAAIAALEASVPVPIPMHGSFVPVNLVSRAVSLRSLRRYRGLLARAAK